MREVLDFLQQLACHNDRDWFAANKAVYRRCESIMRDFAVALIDGIGEFDASVRGLSPSDCTYRIYRDTRFSTDKSPYKTWMGVYVAPHGKKSGYAGYYFHAEPSGGAYLGGSLLSAGLYMPEPVVLRSVREEILDNGQDMLDAVASSAGFALSTENSLKRNPKDFPAGSRFDELLRLRDFYIEKPLGSSDMLSADLLDNTLRDFRSASGFVSILNRAVRYAHEEMM